MATIKKAYQDLIALLENNADATVSDILPQAIALASAKTGGGGSHATTFHKDEDGNVIGVRCFYFKKWMNPNVVPFGAKKTSPTGLNSMCKEGVSNWTKQQREFAKGKEALLQAVASGDESADNIASRLEELEEARQTIVDSDLEMFDTLEDLLDAYTA